MTDKRITVAESLLQELQLQGADTIFGIISIHNIPVFDALERRRGFRVVSAQTQKELPSIWRTRTPGFPANSEWF